MYMARSLVNKYFTYICSQIRQIINPVDLPLRLLSSFNKLIIAIVTIDPIDSLMDSTSKENTRFTNWITLFKEHRLLRVNLFSVSEEDVRYESDTLRERSSTCSNYLENLDTPFVGLILYTLYELEALLFQRPVGHIVSHYEGNSARKVFL